MDRVADFESEGCGFESRRARHNPETPRVSENPWGLAGFGHKHAATTRVYVQRVAVKKDKHSTSILDRLDV